MKKVGEFRKFVNTGMIIFCELYEYLHFINSLHIHTLLHTRNTHTHTHTQRYAHANLHTHAHINSHAHKYTHEP